MPGRQWRLSSLTAGGMECVVGAAVCRGEYPVLGGARLAAPGAMFCALLAYVLVKQVPGGRGCIRWRAATETAAEAPTWRAMARSGMLLGVGVAYTVVSIGARNAPRQYWFGAGVVAGTTVLVLLSMPKLVRTPVCRRPLWRKTRTTLRALASHESFAAMADSTGPLGPWPGIAGRVARMNSGLRSGRPGQPGRGIAGRSAAPGARLAVHMWLRDVPASGAAGRPGPHRSPCPA